jgi:hypothetical protein
MSATVGGNILTPAAWMHGTLDCSERIAAVGMPEGDHMLDRQLNIKAIDSEGEARDLVDA